MSKRVPELLIEDILLSSQKIFEYTNELSFKEFISNSMVVDAVIRNFEIIGEAANRLPEEFKDKHPEVDWFRIRGFRNRIVHDYVDINYKIIWEIKNNFLPDMIKSLSSR